VSDSDPSMLDAALAHATAGRRVHPCYEPLYVDGEFVRCSCGMANCASEGKHPRVLDWPNLATTDEAQIRAWWAKWPNANIGMATEGRLFLDFDPKNGGLASLQRLLAEHPDLELAPRNLTGQHPEGRGVHLRFRQNGTTIKSSTNKVAPGVDVRADGGMVIVGPSLHKSGVRYEWGDGEEPVAPPWLEALAQGEGGDRDSGQGQSRTLEGLRSNPPDSGDRNQWSASWCGHAARTHRGDRVAYESACLQGWELIEDRHGFDLAEFRGVMDSIWNTDRRNVENDDVSEMALAPDGFRLTDVGNAERFIQLSGGRVRYAHAWGCWLVYRGGRWIRDPKDALVMEMAKKVAKSLMRLVPRLNDKERDAVFAHAKRAESRSAISAMVQLARGVEGVIVEHEELDADPFILNCRNGTVDLRTGELRPHDPADLCTMQVPVDYDPEALAPLWEACLTRWQPDPEIREYLQREAGAGTTGRQTETLSIHYGHGANGKSKFFGAVQSVLGPYAVVPHKSLLVTTKHEQHATVLASLFRARLAVAQETSQTAHINEDQVKHLTGNDRISARRMREDEWAFWPSHTLAVVSNFLPTIRGTDDGIWRRVRLVPWDVTIPEEERDEQLAEKLAQEASGILRWLVEGAVRFVDQGIGAPASIEASSAEYRGEQNTVARFVEESLAFVKDGSVLSSVLQTVHDEWCEEAGVDDRGHWKRVTSELTKRGARAERRKAGRYWSGVVLIDQQGELL